MNDLVLMCKLHGCREFSHQLSRSLRIPRSSIQSICERAVLDQLHRDVRQTFIFAKIVNLNDMWMMKRRDDARFTTETREQVGSGHPSPPHRVVDHDDRPGELPGVAAAGIGLVVSFMMSSLVC